MIPRFKSKFLVFEIAVIAGMIGVGWALYHAYGTFDDLSRQQAEPAPRPDTRQVQQLRTLVELRGRYLTLADRVEKGLRLMSDGLEAFVQDRTVTVGRYTRETEHLQRRLMEMSAPPDSVEAATTRDELTTNTILRSEDWLAKDLRFHEFLTNVIQTVSNHVANLNVNDAQPLTPDIVQRKISRAITTEREVAARITECHARAGRLDSLLEQKAVALVAPRIHPGAGMRMASLQRVLERIMTILAAVFLLQAIVAIVALYRHIVVIPLHQRIIENTATAEYQRKLDHFARLATGLAHEIRNPLTAINIRLFTLQKSLSSGGSQHADTVLIRNEIDRLEQILKNFLRLARPSEPKLAQLTARPLLEETRTLLSEQCRRRGVDLRVEKVTTTPFLGDSLQLKQVLINLVQNGAESIEDSGSVTMRAYDSRALNGEAADKSIVIEITDTGSGITPDVQERLFDPFFSTKENGTGLGLPIAAKIVDQHKGRLEFETQAAHGATFRVILPADSELKINA